MTKDYVTVLLDSEDIQRLADISRETGRGRSGLIREAVKKYLRENILEWAKKHGEKE